MKRWPFAALLLAAATAAAQEMTAAHMEGCLVWNREGNVTVRNECSRPLALQYMDTADQRVVAIELPPGAHFTADSVWGRSGGFIFTACPVGLKPSLRFAIENQEPIAASLYNCVAGRPTS